jgi:hypothetical protein
MNNVLLIVFIFVIAIPGSTFSQDAVRHYVTYTGKSYDIRPALLAEKPGIPYEVMVGHHSRDDAPIMPLEGGNWRNEGKTTEYGDYSRDCSSPVNSVIVLW